MFLSTDRLIANGHGLKLHQTGWKLGKETSEHHVFCSLLGYSQGRVKWSMAKWYAAPGWQQLPVDSWNQWLCYTKAGAMDRSLDGLLGHLTSTWHPMAGGAQLGPAGSFATMMAIEVPVFYSFLFYRLLPLFPDEASTMYKLYFFKPVPQGHHLWQFSYA